MNGARTDEEEGSAGRRGIVVRCIISPAAGRWEFRA